jgi:DNA-binding transcriptional MocR family regulator
MDKYIPTWQIRIPDGVIDLGIGDPSFSLLPLDLMRRAAENRFALNDPTFLQYGAEQGDGYFRMALADFLSKGYGFSVNADSLFVTAGISSGLNLLCSQFTRPGDTIFVEEPSYLFALRIFADHNLRIVPVKTDENGLVVEFLQEKLLKYRPKFLYIIPTHQNPAGHTTSAERRERVIELSQRHGFMILADEVYHLLSYTGQPPKPFAAYTDLENVISLSSFSKILAPGLRLGWLQAHPNKISILAKCGLLRSGGGMNPFTSVIVRGALENGDLEKNVARLKTVYSSRLALMDAALRRYLPQVTYTVPDGGYFFWVRLSDGMDATQLQTKAAEYKVNFRPGALFSSQGRMRDYLRLCFAFYGDEEIEEGIKRLAQCLAV